MHRCNKESKIGDIIDFEVYARLVDLDTKLGTCTAEQLFICLNYTTRWEIIKVEINIRSKVVNIILDNRFQKRQRI